jgi:hypothetical protein
VAGLRSSGFFDCISRDETARDSAQDDSFMFIGLLLTTYMSIPPRMGICCWEKKRPKSAIPKSYRNILEHRDFFQIAQAIDAIGVPDGIRTRVTAVKEWKTSNS